MTRSSKERTEISLMDHETEKIPEQFRLSSYQYFLPPELIAQSPAPTRDRSRLLALSRTTGELKFLEFAELPTLLLPTDLLVLNETKVIPAALTAWKASGGRVEILVLDPAVTVPADNPDQPTVRTCITRSSKPLTPGTCIRIENGPELVIDEVVRPGRVRIRFPVAQELFLGFLEEYGRAPLPPYIKPDGRGDDIHRLRYQTVYSRVPGSIAAPTAGLHFTEQLLADIHAKGVQVARIVLHVGPGTFTPVRSNDIRHHSMEFEAYEISEDTARQIRKTQAEKRRIIAVGTTSVRALESAALANGDVRAGRGNTDLFIYPGYSFKVVQGLITNFHLPGSTLLMLVCAFAGTAKVMKAYESAVTNNLRFYSYGDVCLIID